MLRAMRTAASGMQAQQMFVDVVAHNLSNVNTNGFKKDRLVFEDLFYQTLRPAGRAGEEGAAPTPLQVGHGARPIASDKLFMQGDTSQTGNPLDLAVEGEGFFQFLRTDGTVAYSRDGSLRLDAEGYVVNSGGFRLTPEIVVPDTSTAIRVSRDGTVSALLAGESEPTDLGQLEIARFVNPAGLEAQGGNLYTATGASGQPLTGAPGDEAFGTIGQGMVEMSNVQVVEEMVSLILAQRAYEVNAKAIQAAEDMIRVANDIKR
jgi:flagellar basal-body rod protein FlgG